MRSDSDSQRLIRQWNREIDADDRRREEELRRARGPWRYLTWAVIWAFWLLFLVALVTHGRPLS